MLEVLGMEAGYGRLTVLRGLSLAVQEGGIVGLLGANGAGKTTAMKALMGLLPVRAGSVEFAGDRIENRKTHEIVARGMTLVPQGRDLFSAMTVRENLLIAGLSFHGRAEAQRLADEQFERFPPLRARAAQPAQALSGGEQQMLAIARALMLRPKLILMDEPTTGLAPRVVKELGAVIRHLAERGNTIVLVEQNLSLALSIAERIYILRDGRTAFEGSAAQLRDEQDVHSYYLSS